MQNQMILNQPNRTYWDKSNLEFPVRNEMAWAHELTQAGQYVVIVAFPCYCRTTGVAVGENLLIESVWERLEQANVRLGELIDELGADKETMCFLYRIPTPSAPVALAVNEWDDSVPF